MATGVNKQTDDVLYLYGITDSVKRKGQKIAGVDGEAPVETIPCAGLVCWISRVSRLDFADNLARNLENLDWLAQMSTRHQAIVAAIARARDVLPARFGTVFMSEASLQANIKKRKRLLLADLKRVKGNQEWGIKVFAARPAELELTSARTGKDYLRAKSELLRRRPSAHTDQQITRFAGELVKMSVATAQGGKITSGRRGLLYHTSLLLGKTQQKRLHALLNRYAREWKGTRQIECTGPWPPYSFVSRSAS